jgi:predicted nucleic acid-binding protein
LNEWSDGIVEGSFTKKEILSDFENLDITIPDSLLKDFENRIYQKLKKKYERI